MCLDLHEIYFKFKYKDGTIEEHSNLFIDPHKLFLVDNDPDVFTMIDAMHQKYD